MELKVKDFIAKNGERFSQLYDIEEGGFPLFYPTAYTTRQLRSGQMHGTQKEQLRAIKKLYEWADQEKPKIDIHQTLLTRNFLKEYHIASLAFFVKLRRGNLNARSISNQKHNATLSAIANYLKWYANEIITDANRFEVAYSIDKMYEAITARRTKKRGSDSRRKQQLLAKKLEHDTERALLSLFNNPLQGLKNKAHFGPRYRNVLSLRILYATGMRIGELLGLQLQDFIASTGGESAYLVVRRNHDDAEDDRIAQPVAKTLGRKLPIDNELEKAISEYLIMRSHVPHVGFRDNDFLLVNHIRGPRQGLALSESSFRSALELLQRKLPALAPLHPHLLRHDWNYRFSIEATNMGMTEEEERESREELMGWKPDSDMSKLYNRRHIQEKAAEIGLRIANDTSKRSQNVKSD